jgi:hypothetical protein
MTAYPSMYGPPPRCKRKMKGTGLVGGMYRLKWPWLRYSLPSGTSKKTQSSFPSVRVMWPLPVKSSARTIRPGSRRIFCPPPNSISPRPLSVTAYCRCDGWCQSWTWPGDQRTNCVPEALNISDLSSPATVIEAISFTSVSPAWVWPSGPVKSRVTVTEVRRYAAPLCILHITTKPTKRTVQSSQFAVDLIGFLFSAKPTQVPCKCKAINVAPANGHRTAGPGAQPGSGLLRAAV